MSRPKKTMTSTLAELCTRFLDRQPKEWRTEFAATCRRRAKMVARLKKQGVITVADLLKRLPRLSPSLKSFGIESICLFKIRQGIPVLLDLLHEPSSSRGVRIQCADALYWLKAGTKVARQFAEIGNRELRSSSPDCYWLEAVIFGLGSPDDPIAVELLVTVFERSDLPGWVRGDAADKLGCVGLIRDRRTTLFRRCREAAIRGLTDESIDVQFWSMYLISQLSSSGTIHQRRKPSDFEPALPKLRHIAANDHRFAPGFWWPMSAEAEDTIGSITGDRQEQDAAERWLGSKTRGESNRD